MKLWEKGYALDSMVEKFMTGDDPQLDQALVSYDCIGSIAHAKMLEKIGILTATECAALENELTHIMELHKKGEFFIQDEDEDVHTAIERVLVEKLGDIGKKLHTARSRNDQILLDLRLYSRDWILKVSHEVLNVSSILFSFAQEHKNIPMPGRTHFQHAMPSSMGLWAASYGESMLDNIEMMKSTYEIINQCPLGSAASYGVSLPIDRSYCAELLNFRTVQNNVLYANNSRGKFEALILNNLVQIMNDLSKICTDVIIFCAPEFGYIELPEKFCPGSSLMPQKRNPCPLELIRAKSATLQGMFFQVLEIIRGLPSGYNRDFQETKRPLMQGLEITYSSLKVFGNIFKELKVNTEKCLEAFTPELFATDDVLELVKSGIPFRHAYQKIAKNIKEVILKDPLSSIESKIHQGTTGNLGIENNWIRIKEYKDYLGKINFYEK